MSNIQQINLRTTFHGGQECVDRQPPTINPRRKDVDIVRLTNVNPTDTGSTITVTLDADTLGNVFVDPPAGPVDLDPGESLDLTVKPQANWPQREGFTTDPSTCQHHDSGDIVIQP
jgi:hypothetical protein